MINKSGETKRAQNNLKTHDSIKRNFRLIRLNLIHSVFSLKKGARRGFPTQSVRYIFLRLHSRYYSCARCKFGQLDLRPFEKRLIVSKQTMEKTRLPRTLCCFPSDWMSYRERNQYYNENRNTK